MDKVFLVSHSHELPNGIEDLKIIGIFSSADQAEAAIERAKHRPGFLDSPEGFHFEGYDLNKEEWLEGFVTWMPPPP